MTTATSNRNDGREPVRVRRRFTHAERVTVLLLLDANRGASIRAIARKLGIPETTVRRWASGERSPAAKDAAPRHREQLADVFEGAAWELLAFSRERIEEADFLPLIKGAALAAEKAVMLRQVPKPRAPEPTPAALAPERRAVFAQLFGERAVPNAPGT